MFKKLFQLKELLLSVLFIFTIFVSTTVLAETKSSQSIKNSVVSLKVGENGGGTAFYIGEGRFVTNFHVVHGLTFLSKNVINSFENFYVRYGNKKILIKEILQLDALNDLAVLKVSSKDISLLEERMKPLEIQSSIKLKSDSKYQAIAIDYTAQIPQPIQLPINSESLVLKDGDLRFSGNIKPGMSGSPILSSDDEVIGVIKAKLESNNFATPSTDLFRLLKEKPLFCKNTSCIKAELESLKTKAQNGDVKAQFSLGVLYENEDNKEEAKEWYLKAAKQGHANAQFMLGALYEDEDNLAESKKWYLKAAAQGDANAQINLGVLYYNEGNKEEAKKWYLKAAEQGEVNAQNNLGFIYYNEGNLVEAIKWYSKAAAQGDVIAQFMLGWLYENEGNKEEAKKWYLKAAEQGEVNAQNNLGFIYYNEGNLAEARKWFKKAAAQGDVIAQFMLGWLYENEGNLAEAKKWYLKAAEQGEVNAQNNLGVIYYNEGNLAEAIKWHSKAEESILKKPAKKSIKIIKNSSSCKKSFTK